MSRSKPSNNVPNPSTRRYQWRGKDGTIEYYDCEQKENLPVKLPFTFILLDELATVSGYNKKRNTGLYANEVRDTREQPFLVKFQDDGSVAAEGLWKDIKDRVTVVSGKFAINCYIAFKSDSGGLELGSMRMSGCALGPWFDFMKEHRHDVYEKAVTVSAGKPDTSGAVEFTPPAFGLKDIKEDTNQSATELDKQLQEYLDGYFSRPAAVRASQSEPAHEPSHQPEHQSQPDADQSQTDDVPF